jgi:hypothetical protein
MTDPKVRRITRPLLPAQRARLERNRRRVAAELPDLTARDQMRREASQEPTLSGELRRAIHASSLPLGQIAAGAGVSVLVLDEFLTGERTLRSDVLDRLATALSFALASRT